MKKFCLVIFSVLLFSTFLAACSSDPALQPAPLVKFTPTFNPDYQWARSVSNGSNGYYLRLTPAIVGNTLYVSGFNGTMMSLNRLNGHLNWQSHTQLSYISGLTASDGNLYVATNGAHLVAIKQSNGQLLWNIRTSSQVLAPPTIADGRIIVNAIDGTLTAYSQQTGKQLWQYDQDVPDLILHLASQPVVSGPYVVAGFANGKVSVLNLATGVVLWEKQIAEPEGATIVSRMVDVDLTPVVRDGVLYIAGYQGNIVALNLIDGTQRWTHKLSAYAGLAADDNALYITDFSGSVWAFDKETGAVLWKQAQLARRGLTAPIVVGNNLAVADKEGYLHFLATKDGHLVGRARASLEPIIATPLYADHMLYVYSESGRLNAYKL